MSKSLPQELIHDYVDDRLNETERQRVEAHLRQHEADAATVRQLRQMRTLLRKSRRYKLDDQFSQRVLTAIEQQSTTSGHDVESSLTPIAEKPVPAASESTAAGRMDWRVAAGAIAALAAMLVLALILVQKPDQQPVAHSKGESAALPDEFVSSEADVSTDSAIANKKIKDGGGLSDEDGDVIKNEAIDLEDSKIVLPESASAGRDNARAEAKPPEMATPSTATRSRAFDRKMQEKSAAAPEGALPIEKGSRSRQATASPGKDLTKKKSAQLPQNNSKSDMAQRGGGRGGSGGLGGGKEEKVESRIVDSQREPLDVVIVSTRLTADDLAAINEFSVAQAGEFKDGGIFSKQVPLDVDGADKKASKEIQTEIQSNVRSGKTLMFNVEATDVELEKLLAKIGGNAIIRGQLPLEPELLLGSVKQQRFTQGETPERNAGDDDAGNLSEFQESRASGSPEGGESESKHESEKDEANNQPADYSTATATKERSDGPVVESVPTAGTPTGDLAASKRKQFLLVVQLLPPLSPLGDKKAKAESDSDSGESSDGSENKSDGAKKAKLNDNVDKRSKR